MSNYTISKEGKRMAFLKSVSPRSLSVCFFSVGIVGLILLAPNVNAETAWIKWEHIILTMKDGIKTREDNWFLQEAFPSYNACLNEISGTVKTMCTLNFISGECSAEGTSVFINSDKTKEYIEFYCYPDTIDPRKK